MEARDLKLTLIDAVTVLVARNFKFHLTGGFAASFYGEPRFTQDIDFVIQINDNRELPELVQDISSKFIIDFDAVIDAVQRNSIFQALHKMTMIKIDFHVGEAIPGELDRSRKEEILSGVMVPLVSKEDAILSKLIWISKGSHKSKRDVIMMLRRPEGIDFDYLNIQASKLSVETILKELSLEVDKYGIC